ncbi:Nucleoside 5-triphosphatase RdgB [Klebsiella michiganensis]|nr:Nucleoside 5-triphosphatase RdgB [Klebsiella michiganensis]STV86572.1 Nucleoside 5-triphosphatase RdgB [Klebsiella michiganensis]
MQKVVLATGNPGKVRELASLLADFGLDIVAQTELGVDSAEETGLTFIENAILKARHAAQITGLPAIADDSGLAVDALGGAPGIYSARYSGEDATDQRNLEKLLDALRDVPDDRRQAQFHCVLVYLRHAEDPTRWFATAAGRASSLAKPQAAAALVTTRYSLFRRKVKPQRS